MQTHFGDPCIHCGTPHDDVEPGACKGDPDKAIILAYCVWRQAWQNPGNGCETVRCKMSDGSIRDEQFHPDEVYYPYTPRFANAETIAPNEFARRYGRPH